MYMNKSTMRTLLSCSLVFCFLILPIHHASAQALTLPSRTLEYGNVSPDVRLLQQALNLIGKSVTAKGEETTRFGEKTRSVIQSLQCANGIACAGQQGYGVFGPRTRALLLTLLAKVNPRVLGATTDGMVAYYPLDGSAVDTSGNNNNGTLTNNSGTWVSGKIGTGALRLAGNDYVNVPHSASLDASSAITISAWVKVPAGLPGNVGLMSRNGVFQIRASESGGSTFYTYNDSNTLRGFGGPELRNDTWHHVAYVYDSNSAQPKAKIYSDGNLVATDNGQNGTLAVNTNGIKIGMSFDSEYANATIDDVRIYNRALSASEIGELNALGTDVAVVPVVTPPADPVAPATTTIAVATTTPPIIPVATTTPIVLPTFVNEVVQPISSPLAVAPLIDDHSMAFMSAGPLAINKPNWYFYNSGDAPEGAYMGWLFAGTASLTADISLPRNLEAKRYYVFTDGISYNTGTKIQILAGGGASNIDAQDSRDSNKYWSHRMTIDVTSPTNVLTVKLIKGGDVSTEEKYLFKGLYITDNPNEVVSRDDIAINLNYPTVMDTSAPVKGNLITNSSFETGVDNNWGFGDNKVVDLTDSIDNSVAYDGHSSLRIPLDPSTNSYGGQAGIVSKVYHLKPNKKYTISMWVKSSASKYIGMHVNNTYTYPEGNAPAPVNQALFTNGDWQRISATFTALDYPKSDYQFDIGANLENGGNIWVDAVQLEEGDITPYQPGDKVEAGLVISTPSNIFYKDESPAAAMLIRNNTTSAQTREFKFEIYNYLNKKVGQGSRTLTMGANSNQTSSLSLTTGETGIFRVVYWIDGEPESERELSYSIIPRPAAGDVSTSFLGIHTSYNAIQLDALKKMGILWNRDMSPSELFRWTVIEPVNNQFLWKDSRAAIIQASGFQVMGTLGVEAPAWAGGATDNLNLTEWEDYVRQTVGHYKSFGIKNWEIWNEPYATFSPDFYAQMLKRAVDVIEQVDPEAKIIGMGGIPLGDSGHMQDFNMLTVIKALETRYPNWDWKSHMDALSTHDYVDGIPPEIFKPAITDVYGLPVWNTETGAWDRGFYQGQDSNFTSFGKNLWPHIDASRYYNGMIGAPAAVVTNFIRTVGSGQTRYFYYDSRIAASPLYILGHPTILEQDLTIRAKGIAYAIAGNFVDHSTAVGNLSSDSKTFAYTFERNGEVTTVLWSKDAKARWLDVGLGASQFTMYDMMGNPISASGSSIPYGRLPVYIKSVGVTPAAFKQAILAASSKLRTDSNAPTVSISDAPRGTVNDRSFRVRWIAIDDISYPNLGEVNPESNASSQIPDPSALLYSYHLLNSAQSNWSAWTPATYADYTNLPDGVYTFEVKAKDETGNVSNTVSRSISISSNVPVDPNNPSSDSTAPSVSITSPVAGATVSGSVGLAVTATDDVGVVGVQYAVNGTNVGDEAGSPFTGIWNTSLMSDGTYALTATARDAAGNTKTSAAVSVIVHNGVVAPANLPPVANAGPDQTITLPASATLSGSLSSDPDQTTLAYSWTTNGGTLTNANTVSPTVSFATAGTYTMTLTVSDGSLSSTDQMTITVLPAPIMVTVLDADHDGVADAADVCANTPAGLAVNLLGCPLPKTTEFPTLTNLQSVDLRSVSTFEIGNAYGKISYPVASLPYSLVRKVNGIDNRLDIDAALEITQGKVSLDATALPELNRPAVITLYNMRLNKPAIKKNGAICSGCVLVSYDTGTKVLVFSVTGFSTYEIVEDDTVTEPVLSGGSSAPAQSGGGGGGGISYIPHSSTGTFVPTVVAAPRLTVSSTPHAVMARPGAYAFTRNLTIGAKGDDVRQLQRFLNGAGFGVAASGAGSPGSESTTFGPATQRALARFQASKGIRPAAGYFGPATRAVVGGGMTAPSAAVPTPAASALPASSGITLRLGSTGAAVKALRVRLRSLGYLAAYGSAADVPASAAAETSSFGATTEAALRKFQCDKSIVCTGTAATTGWGSAGARTRAALGL
jgi:hypothetical protein